MYSTTLLSKHGLLTDSKTVEIVWCPLSPLFVRPLMQFKLKFSTKLMNSTYSIKGKLTTIKTQHYTIMIHAAN